MTLPAHLNAAALVAAKLKAALPVTEDYAVVRADFDNRLTDAFLSFAGSGGNASRGPRNEARSAVAEDVPAAFYRGYKDAGGEETDPDDEDWLTGEQARQLAFMNDALSALKQQAADETVTEDGIKTRVENWLSTLDGIYASGKLRGKDNVMLTFDGDDGKESCKECQRYKGQRHSAKWWIKRDLVRRNGNDNYGCGRWANCQHDFYTDDGELYA
jgi:hypothetical protein